MLGQNLSTSSAANVRRMCFTCHTSWDGRVWDSVASSYDAVSTTEIVEGLRRDGTGGNRLLLPSISGHGVGDTQSCFQCHGSSYSAGGNNVHNPSGGASAGGTDCFACHSYQSMQSSSSYHHFMASSSAATPYATIADPTSLTETDARRTCLMCHVDHDYFDTSINGDPAHTNGRAQNLRASVAKLRTGATADVSVDVTNTGRRRGDDVVQLYVRYPASKVERPAKQLRGFRRVSLEPGETRTVTLPLAAADLAYWDSGRHAFVVEPGPVELLAGRSSADHDLTLRRTIVVVP